MSETTVRQATLSRIPRRASRFSSASRLTAARWCGPAPGSPMSSCATPSSSRRCKISILASIAGSMAEGLWIPSRRVSSSTSARANSPRPAVWFQSWNSSCGRILRSLRRLEEQRDPLPTADAGRSDAAARTPPPHLVQQVRRDPRSGSGQRAPHRDGPPVDVGAIARQAQVLLHRQVLGRERLVHLEEIEVARRGRVTLEPTPDRGRRPDPHDGRIATGDAPADELAERLQPFPLGELTGREDQRARAVADATGGAGVDHPVLLENLGQLGQALQRRLRAVVLVLGEVDHRALLARQVQGGNLVSQPPALLGRGETLLALHAVLVHFL